MIERTHLREAIGMFRKTPIRRLISACWSVAAGLAIPAFIQYIDLAMDMDGRPGQTALSVYRREQPFQYKGNKKFHTVTFCPAFNQL